MKRKDLLILAACFLMGMPAFAQEGPTFDTSRDAKVVFVQDFEADWEDWTISAVDSIFGINYYNREGSGSISNANIYDGSWDWDVYGTRDTIIFLHNGARPTGVASDIEAMQDEYYSIIVDESYERQDAFLRYGEFGGSNIFRYVSGNARNTSGYSNGTTPRYSRNLFVRGLPIEDNTSYRLTLFVKARKIGASAPNPVFYADVLRGCDNSEKPFVMDLDGVQATNSWGYTTTSLQAFEFTKDNLKDGEWEKVTFMTYYTNDSILNGYMYRSGYWWGEGDWTWNQDGVEHNYIMQPDKFMVRLAFASDSTEFSVDNISLTKSSIGGVEYYNNKIRVDFGYQTNLGELAKAAYDKNKIAAVEIPGAYFEVWGLTMGDWERIPISSAEYHADGYMYMFTDTYEYDGYSYPYILDYYDKVIVSYHNPVDDPSICLKYTGNFYPNSLDKEWIANGKKVLDFYNEEASLNPYAFEKVYSMKDMPPVLQEEAFEDGSFGLDGNIRSLSFKFSKEVLCDNLGEATTLAVAVLENDSNKEIWLASSSDSEGNITFERQAKYTAPLSGNYVFKIVQIQGKNGAYSDDIVLKYHFGDYVPSPGGYFELYSDWRGELEDPDITSGALPASVYVHDASSYFQKGMNTTTRTKSRLFVLDYSDLDNCGFYLANRSSNSGVTGNLYTIVSFDKAGVYSLSFKATIWNASSLSGNVYFYAKPDGELEDGNENGFALLEAVDKTLLGTFTPATKVNYSNIQNKSTGKWPEKVETFTYDINVPAAGDYMLEWVVYNGNTSGMLIGNYTIVSLGDPYTAAVTKLNKAIVQAEKYNNSLAFIYACPAQTELVNLIAYAKSFTGTNAGQYEAVINQLNDAVEVLQERVIVIDDLLEVINTASEKLDSLLYYGETDAYESLSQYYNDVVNYMYPNYSENEINDIKLNLNILMENLDKRIALIDKLYDLLKKTGSLIESGEKEQSQPYIALSQVYKSYGKMDYMTVTDQNFLEKAVNDLSSAIFNYESIFVTTKRLEALYSLASELGSEVVNISGVRSAVENATLDDDDLVGLLKSAVKLAIYEKIDDGSDIDTINLTPFFKNYNLYVTPKVVDRSDYAMPSNKSILSEPDPDGAQIQLVQHQWNSGDLNGHLPIWIMIPGQTYYDLYPGWEAISYSSSSMCMVTPDKEYSNFINGVPIFDGTLAMDWNSNAALTTVLQDLPAGEYTLGVEILENTSSNTYLTASTIFDTYTIHAATDWFGETTINGINVTNGELSVTLDLMSSSGWSRADNFSLIYTNPSYDFDYSAGLADAKTELNNALVALGYSQVEPVDPFEELRYILYSAIDSANCKLNRAYDYCYRGSDYYHLQSVIFDVLENNSSYESEYQFYAVIDSLSYYSFLLSERINIVNNTISALDAASEELEYQSEYSYLDDYAYLKQIYRKNAKYDFQDLSYQELSDLIGVIYDVIYDLEEAIANIDNPEEPEEYGFYMDEIYCESGSNVVIPVKMRNDKPVVGFSLDVKLPEGITFVSAELDKNRSNGHKLSVNVSGEWAYEVVSFACLSSENYPIIGSDSTIIYLTVSVPVELNGNYKVLLTNAEMTFDALSYCIPEDYDGLLAVFQSYVLPGDVNSDERISITDAVGIINFIINADTKDLNRRAADANQDGLIDAADVVYVVNIVIHKNNTQSRSSGLRTITSSLSMDDVNTNGSGFSLPVSLNGMQNEITAIQFNMDLPDDIVLNGVNTDNSHIAAYQQQADGSYTVVCVSMSNSTFAGNGDAAMSLDLSAGKEFDGGQVVLSNASLVTPDCLKATQDQVVFSLDKNTTGINGIGIDSDSEMFDVLGRVADDTNGIRIQGGQKSLRIK